MPKSIQEQYIVPERDDAGALSELREEAKLEIDEVFHNTIEKRKDGIEQFSRKLQFFQQCGLVLDINAVISGLNECLAIENKEDFVARALTAIEPYLLARIQQSEIFALAEKKLDIENEREERQALMKAEGHVSLSEVLYADFGPSEARIHLAPAHEFITKSRIEDFNTEIEKGLRKLAEIIRPMKEIAQITATSWIVTKSPKRLLALGFTIDKNFREEQKNSQSEVIHIGHAFMDREAFLSRYLDKGQSS